MAEIFRANVSTSRMTVNGKTYSSINEMPPDVRAQYEKAMRSMMADKDGDGIPDLLENRTPGSSTSVNVMVNGTTYHRLEDVPPEFRKSIMNAMSHRPTSSLSLGGFSVSSSSLSMAKWILLIAALFVAGAIGWLLRGG
ncbi:MAG TPA: hypothetical protein VL282_19165 [Tepidisphaeraceae bacterium]|nr:hypothetical protein [Tepidisphaeraceae bacterium]